MMIVHTRRLALMIGIMLLGALLMPLEKADAAAPTDIAPDAGVTVTDYVFELLTNSTFVRFGSLFYADEIAVHGTHVDFTNMALSSASNPTQTFGIGVASGNATISEINSGSVSVTMSCTESAQCDVQYYTSASVPVYYIHLNNGLGAATVTNIDTQDFVTSASAFASASAPAVYFNSAGGYYQVKLTYSNPTIVTFYLAPASGGGGGGPGPTPDPTPDPTPGPSFTISAVLPPYALAPGTSQERTMTITVTGTTQIVISSLTFSQHPEWFTVNKQLPYLQNIELNGSQITVTIPITLTYPATETTDPKQFDAILIATNTASQATVHVLVQITSPPIQLPPIPEIPGLPPILSGPPFYHNVWNLASIFGLLLLTAIILGAARKKRKLRIRR